jgi:NAD(P)-dependent dehydrogenase (short-subunit alcohol dehydrogenase family)
VAIVRVTQAAPPLLRKSTNPVVVDITSALGSFWAVANPGHPAEVKFNAVDPGPTATDLTAGRGGRPVEESAGVIVRMAAIGADGPTGTFQVDAGELPW